MSAIGGLVLPDGASAGQQHVQRLIDATPHIRRDTVGNWCGGPAALVHFNLVTTPQARHEALPLAERDSGLVVMLDGRFDNRAELLDKVGRDAGLDQHSGDGALLLALFKRYGTECVQHLAGDYSLVVWQGHTRQLFCARSPLGWRPFLWHHSAAGFGFATEPRTLIEGLGLARELNEGAMGEFLAMRFTSQTETLWRGIYRLAPGAALMLADGQLRHWHWQRGPFAESTDSDSVASERFRALFDQSLQSCMRSDGPVAAHLSGGLDSSSIVCRATELHRAGLLANPLQPLSARFPGDLHDETEWSAAVEAHLGLEALIVPPRSYDWDKARQWSADTLHLPLRPNTLSTIIGSCEQMRAHGMRVLLTGEGGDDWLSGSHGHWPDLLRAGRVLQLWRDSKGERRKLKFAGRLMSVLAEGVGPLLSPRRRARLQMPHLQFSTEAPAWLSPQWAQQIGLAERWRAVAPPLRLDGFALQQRAARYTMARPHINVDNVLSMAACSGVELRHPFHDLRLTSYLMGARGDHLRRNGERKFLLRQAMRGTLPDKVRTRQTKADLSEPIIDALDALFVSTPIKDLPCVRMGWVDPAYLARSIAINGAWYRNGAKGPRPDESIGVVWAAVSAGIWFEQALRR
ncbi:MAG: asparagine synthase-related protein [Pseudomonadota bacterium]